MNAKAKTILKFPRYVFSVYGFFWLVLEPFISLAGKSLSLTFTEYVIYSFLVGSIYFLIDGFFFSGFLKYKIQLNLNGFNVTMKIQFGDIFKFDGWTVIPVNDFFDSIVDEKHISSKSLHGKMLTQYWAGNPANWDEQICNGIHVDSIEYVSRVSGKQKRYPIGTTVATNKQEKKFLCTVLGKTNLSNLQVKADAIDLYNTIRGLLQEARSVCSDEPINIPLVGGGLSRTGIKYSILLDLIIVAIIDELKNDPVTTEIRLILPKSFSKLFNLSNIKEEWS